MGPFIDTDHPLLCDGVLDLATADPSENGDIDYLFKEQISSRLAKASEDTLILLVPHVRDAVSKQACFPQEPLNRIKFGLPKVGNSTTQLTEECKMFAQSGNFLY